MYRSPAPAISCEQHQRQLRTPGKPWAHIGHQALPPGRDTRLLGQVAGGAGALGAQGRLLLGDGRAVHGGVARVRALPHALHHVVVHERACLLRQGAGRAACPQQAVLAPAARDAKALAQCGAAQGRPVHGVQHDGDGHRAQRAQPGHRALHALARHGAVTHHVAGGGHGHGARHLVAAAAVVPAVVAPAPALLLLVVVVVLLLLLITPHALAVLGAGLLGVTALRLATLLLVIIIIVVVVILLVALVVVLAQLALALPLLLLVVGALHLRLHHLHHLHHHGGGHLNHGHLLVIVLGLLISVRVAAGVCALRGGGGVGGGSGSSSSAVLGEVHLGAVVAKVGAVAVHHALAHAAHHALPHAAHHAARCAGVGGGGGLDRGLGLHHHGATRAVHGHRHAGTHAHGVHGVAVRHHHGGCAATERHHQAARRAAQHHEHAQRQHQELERLAPPAGAQTARRVPAERHSGRVPRQAAGRSVLSTAVTQHMVPVVLPGPHGHLLGPSRHTQQRLGLHVLASPHVAGFQGCLSRVKS
mmetsp:Transcript_32264/g.81983  ORF Transcript_32264/g.81983 Transcript_32264/m.81983 type:complete len:531 (-) Transcript_32264:120-1712(-)